VLRRRLLILSAVLLATGALAAALTPREVRKGATPTATAPPPTPPPAAGGTRARAAEVSATVDAQARRPAVVRTRQGTLVRLVVRVSAPDEVELEGLGRFAPADQYSPARFEFFADRAGSFPIRLREAGRAIGRLVVSARPL
jgi:hypothetical protein